MKPGTVVLEIEQIVAGGYGLARAPEGTVLVRGALPGELVTARPTRSAGVLRAHVVEILRPNPARVDFALPPGADLPMKYEAQLPVKEGLVRAALSRIAKLDCEVEPIHPSPRELGYRTAAQYVVTSEGTLGARARDSDRIVPLTEDALVADPIARAFSVCAARSLHGISEIAFRASLREERVLVGVVSERVQLAERVALALTDSGAAGVVWAAPDARGRFRGRVRVLAGADRLREDFGGVPATVAVQSFAQVNPLAAGAMYLEAAELAGAGRRALDLYAGSGVLGLHLARAFEEVVAVEISPDAVRLGEADARRIGAGNVVFRRGDARIGARHFPVDAVVLDPPRAGLAAEVLALVVEHAPPRIVYASCDPSTWARDVGYLARAGYRLRFVRPYDFYPFTHHVEVLSLLER
ncbi:MAG: RsmD family RNA methyltransferase [Actinomycetota bacterium]